MLRCSSNPILYSRWSSGPNEIWKQIRKLSQLGFHSGSSKKSRFKDQHYDLLCASARVCANAHRNPSSVQ